MLRSSSCHPGLLDLVHRSAWKVFSPNFACTGFSEIGTRERGPEQPGPQARRSLIGLHVARVVVDEGRTRPSRGYVARVVVDEGRTRARPEVGVPCSYPARREGAHPPSHRRHHRHDDQDGRDGRQPPSRPPLRGIGVPTPPRAAPCACITVPPSVASVGYRASRIAGARYRSVTSNVTSSCFRGFPFFLLFVPDGVTLGRRCSGRVGS